MYELREEFKLTTEQVDILMKIDVWDRFTKSQISIIDNFYYEFIEKNGLELANIEAKEKFGGYAIGLRRARVIVLHFLCGLQNKEVTIQWLMASLSSRDAYRKLVQEAFKKV